MAGSLNNGDLSTPDDNLGESELANKLQEFVTQLTKNQSRIRSFIVALMPGNSDVGDVLQEKNLVLWKSRERFQLGTNFPAWAFTVARLEVLHCRARTKRTNRMVLSEELLNLISEEMPESDDYVTDLNDATTILSTKIPASSVSDNSWETIDLGSVKLADGYDFYAWRIGILSATVNDRFAFDNVRIAY